MNVNFDAIRAAAEGYKDDMSKFLRDMIAIPSESCEEEGVVKRIAAELEKLGYDEVKVDGLGNVMGFMGEGDKIIAIDSHIDTVGIGNIENWDADPYEGYETDEIIYGRGGSDQEGGMASATYAAKMMKDMGLIPEGYKIMVVGTVQEEDCDGMCWQYIVNDTSRTGTSEPDRIRHFHRAHRRRHLSRSPRPHGDPRRRSRHLLPRLRSRPRRQRHPQDGRQSSPTSAPSTSNALLTSRPTIKGLVKMLDPKYNPEHLRGRPLPGPRHLHHLPDLLHLPQPLRCC